MGTATTNNYGVNELAYHNEWEWLMPVVESIGKMGYFIQIQFDTMFTDPAACIVLKRGKPTVSIKGQDLHDCVYKAVVCVIRLQ